MLRQTEEEKKLLLGDFELSDHVVVNIQELKQKEEYDNVVGFVTSFGNLPSELIIHIANYLEIKDLIHFLQTCKGVRLIASENKTAYEFVDGEVQRKATYTEIIQAFGKIFALNKTINELEKEIEKNHKRSSVYSNASYISLVLGISAIIAGGGTMFFGWMIDQFAAEGERRIGDSEIYAANYWLPQLNGTNPHIKDYYYGHLEAASKGYAEANRLEAKAKIEFTTSLGLIGSGISMLATTFGFFRASKFAEHRAASNEVHIKNTNKEIVTTQNQFPVLKNR